MNRGNVMSLFCGAIAILAMGCQSGPSESTESDVDSNLKADDFIDTSPKTEQVPWNAPSELPPTVAPQRPSSPTNTAASTPNAAAGNPTTPAGTGIGTLWEDDLQKQLAKPPVTPDGKERIYMVDAMVGQVSGRPVYASQVFDAIGEEQLSRLGETLSRPEFRAQSNRLINSHLRQVVSDALILAEAERTLTENEQRRLQAMLKIELERILAKWGGGSRAQAESRLMAEKGVTVQDEIESRRQKFLVDKYLKDQLWPKVHVSREEVERYYETHPEEYNPAPAVVIQVIIVADTATADKVDAGLASGKSFADVAKEFSKVRAEQGGELPEMQLDGPLSSFKALRWTELNEQIQKMKQGEQSPRTAIGSNFGWVRVKKLQQAEGKPLKDVFLDIEKALRIRRFNALSRKYLDELLSKGSYTPTREMGASLLEVAMSRYAKTP